MHPMGEQRSVGCNPSYTTIHLHNEVDSKQCFIVTNGQGIDWWSNNRILKDMLSGKPCYQRKEGNNSRIVGICKDDHIISRPRLGRP